MDHSDNVKAAIDAFHSALSNLDIGKMQDVWAQEPYAVLVNPRDKVPAVGWDAVKKDWQGRSVRLLGRVEAIAETGAANPHQSRDGVDHRQCGHRRQETKSGQALSFTIIETQAYEKRGDRWLMISHRASQVLE